MRLRLRKPLPPADAPAAAGNGASMREAPEHGEDTVAEAPGRSDGDGIHMAACLRDARAGDELVGAAAATRQRWAVAAVSAKALSEVEGTEAAARWRCWAMARSRWALAASG